MADSKKNVFFIGGYSYAVDKSTPLCRREDFFHSTTLYQSPNGRFFVVENDAAKIDRREKNRQVRGEQIGDPAACHPTHDE